MSDGFRVRAAEASDVDALIALHAALVAEQLPLDPEPPLHPGFDRRRYFERRLQTPGRWTLVAHADEAVVGYVDGLVSRTADGRPSLRAMARALLRPNREAPLRQARVEAYLANVYVRADWRRAGVGLALVEALKERARAAGAEVMHVDVLAGNAPSQSLFEAAAFSPHLVRSTVRLG